MLLGGCLHQVAFDIRTLLVAVLLASAFCAGARFLLWRMHPSIPGVGRWALAGGAGTLAFVMIYLYGIMLWQPLLSLTQLLIVIGLALSLDGFRRFIGNPPLSPRVIASLAVAILVWIVIVQNLHSLEVRALGNAILVAILSGHIAQELLATSKPITPAMRALGWVYAINAIIFALRVVAIGRGAQVADPLNPDGVASFILLWWLCMTIAVTLGMVLMTADRLQADLDGQANLDPLTGALNRRAFSLIAERELGRSHRYDEPLSLLIMDLDNFKRVNDHFGHDAGDALLRRFVSIADETLHNDDFLFRFGGEEFVALLPNTSAEQALVAAERVRITFADLELEEISNDVRTCPISVSIGTAELNEEEDIHNLLRRADVALYTAKNMGRNRCELASS